MIDLYYISYSPPSRAVMMLAKALDVELNLKEVDVLNGEQHEPDFIKINPQHTVPAIVDGSFIISESRAIMAYLATKYAKDDKYYPIDPRRKGIVDHRLYFDIGTLWKRMNDCYFPVTIKIANSVPEEKLAELEKAFEILNVYLENQDYVAGEILTIADFSICMSVTMAEEWGFDITRYENVTGWFERCKEALQEFDYDEFIAPAKMLGDMFRENLEAAD
ncbi:glutathione S-transferase 1-like [Aphidius gifuensis]|uniref:glutathione S-transferase 1-like n=1 Tax=Aphidius gifuensis TaxID=684658 RepID=UPI001CDD3EE4|nr:glutathione S-transferase 1-like [Aphidius gifuensis]